MTTPRTPIGIHDRTVDVFVKMAEGNPGASSVLNMLLQHGTWGSAYWLELDDMNIRGEQIWVAFKDFAGSDVARLAEALSSRDQKMVDVVNAECPAHVAVKRGGAPK